MSRKVAKRKGAVSAYARFAGQYIKSHKGARIVDAAAAWRSSGKKIHEHHKTRAKVHRKGRKGYVPVSAIPQITASAVRGSVCNLEALRRARQKYCKIAAPTKVGIIERIQSAFSDPNRLKSASEMGYRSVANNGRGRKGKRKGGGKKASKSSGPAKFSMSRLMSANTGKEGSLASGLYPKNVLGAMPVFGGLVGNMFVRSQLIGKLPSILSSGIPSYAIGWVSARVLGYASTKIGASKDTARSIRIGGIAQVFGQIIYDLKANGFSAMIPDAFGGKTLKGLSNEMYDGVDAMAGLSGVGDFVTPGEIRGAQPMYPQFTQGDLPQPNQNQHTQEAYQQSVLSEVLG